MRYDVRTAQLRGDSRSLGTSGASLSTTPTDLAAALRALGAASGSPDIASLADDLARGWGRATAGMLGEVHALTRGLSGSATAYDDAERGLQAESGGS
ncbi:hypothetical protein PZ938_18840 [Luteipulveratus sp. YIM 133132]|uniref:hypothetical protein n=1 Tax=Luteipulveratus flavus TaxID=3031728 RepID=UPI0023B11045|nr:hypothetical protein [Luteipulveratus sp. YIM 133132]MDE9367679.1 hypothetical protein [Luteipulveratus sp. YIM 133132]